jgi:hypothetical protein
MRYFSVLILLFLSISLITCKKQIRTVPGESKIIFYNTSKNTSVFKTIKLKDGGFLLVGEVFESGKLGTASYDGWVVRTDKNGNKLWSNTYGGERSDGFRSAYEKDDGTILLCGYTASKGYALNTATSQIPDGWFLTIDQYGKEIMSSSLGGGNNAFDYNGNDVDIFFDLAEAPNGNIILCGITLSVKDTIRAFGHNYAGWLVELEPNGKLVWEQLYFEQGVYWGDCFTQLILKQGEIITSTLNQKAAFIIWNFPVPGSKPVIDKIASYSRSEFTYYVENWQNIAELKNGDFVVTGDEIQSLDSLFIGIFDQDGRLKHFNYIPLDGVPVFRHMDFTDDGILIVGGYKKTHQDNSSGLLILTDINGEVIWEKHFQQQSGMTLISAQLLPSGNILLIGNLLDQFNAKSQVFMMKLNEKGEIY